MEITRELVPLLELLVPLLGLLVRLLGPLVRLLGPLVRLLGSVRISNSTVYLSIPLPCESGIIEFSHIHDGQ